MTGIFNGQHGFLVRECKSVSGCPMFRITDKSLFVQRIAFIEEIGTLRTTRRFLYPIGPHSFTGPTKAPRFVPINPAVIAASPFWTLVQKIDAGRFGTARFGAGRFGAGKTAYLNPA